MRTPLTTFLLVIMLLSGVVLPIHAYAHELTESQNSHMVELDTHHESEKESLACDHCCHFSSHSLGLIQTFSASTNQQTKSISVRQKTIYTSHKQAPPYHPPIA